jgi:hypothetical protein
MQSKREREIEKEREGERNISKKVKEMLKKC